MSARRVFSSFVIVLEKSLLYRYRNPLVLSVTMERILGKVLLDSKDVNLEQVEAGLAWHYKKYQGEQTPADGVKYSDAELDARRHKLGLWVDRDPVPPWEYRQAKREQMNDLESFVGKSTVRGGQ